jgi:hypothetical protein
MNINNAVETASIKVQPGRSMQERNQTKPTSTSIVDYFGTLTTLVLPVQCFCSD